MARLHRQVPPEFRPIPVRFPSDFHNAPRSMTDLPSTLGQLRDSGYTSQSVKDEMRGNLLSRLASGEELFPGILGFDETVIPQVQNAILSRHDMLFLGLRGQGKTRMLRMLVELLDEAIPVLEHLRSITPVDGWFTETYCRQSRYFTPENGARIEGIREEIEKLDLDDELRCVALTALMEAAGRVDSTVRVKMAYLKKWAARALQPLQLRDPEPVPRSQHGKAEAHRLEAREAASKVTADVAYLDPPYNQHKYLGNYHVWETLVRWDQPEVYGIACKRIECRQRRSDFNSKRGIQQAMKDLVELLDCRYLLVSFNNEGFLDRAEIEQLLSTRGTVTVLSRCHPRYVGAKIGIHNPQGRKVGEVSHLKNTEYLFLVGDGGAVSGREKGAVFLGGLGRHRGVGRMEDVPDRVGRAPE